MKFTEKYEILELLTSGRVSTFLARERATQEQAIVHTFECPSVFAAESRTPLILKHFASLAPSPGERATEVGFDEGSSSAYVVTRVPAPDALQSWIRAYRSFPAAESKEVSGFDEDATAEISASEVERLLRQRDRPKTQGVPEPSPQISTEPFSIRPPSTPSPQKGEFTRLFEEPGAFQRLSGRGAPVSSAPVAPAGPISTGPPEIPTDLPTNYGSPSLKATPASPELGLSEPGSAQPGSFTQQFFSGTDDVSDRAAFGGVPAPEQPAVKEPGAFTKEFLAISGKPPQSVDSPSREEPPAKSSPPAPAFGSTPRPVSAASSPADRFEGSSEVLKSSTGEFTSFFRGPLDQPSTPDKPFEYPDPAHTSPPRSRAGDFTQMFGTETRLGAEESPSARLPEQQPSQAPSFTQIFSDNSKDGARLGVSRLDSEPLASEALKPPAASTASPSGMPATFSGTVSSPISSRGGGFSPSEVGGVPGGESAFLNRSGRSDATNVFKPRGSDALPEVPEAPSGPSDFTMFLSSSQLRASLPPEPASPAAPNPAGRAPALPMPSMPSYAAPPPPPLPPAPMPHMTVPQAPPVPRPPAPPSGRAASYWPLITVLTILFAVAALLVMYFALKH